MKRDGRRDGHHDVMVIVTVLLTESKLRCRCCRTQNALPGDREETPHICVRMRVCESVCVRVCIYVYMYAYARVCVTSV